MKRPLFLAAAIGLITLLQACAVNTRPYGYPSVYYGYRPYYSFRPYYWPHNYYYGYRPYPHYHGYWPAYRGWGGGWHSGHWGGHHGW